MKFGELVLDMINGLDSIASEYEGIFDTDVREALSDCIYMYFFTQKNTPSKMQNNFDMIDESANLEIADVIARFLKKANELAEENDWDQARREEEFLSFAGTSIGGSCVDDYFGSP